MPKVRPSGHPFWDGLGTSLGLYDPPYEPTAEEDERHALQREIMRHPCTADIMNMLMAGSDLGVDTDDPAVLRRAIDITDRRYRERLDRSTGVRAYKELLAARRAEKRHPPVIYYMRMSDLVKIGTTVTIGSRFTSLGPQAVMAIEPGSANVEYDRHKQFAHLHDHGEWFRLEEDLGRHIVDVRAAFVEASGQTTEDWLSEWLPRRHPKKFTQPDAPETVVGES